MLFFVLAPVSVDEEQGNFFRVVEAMFGEIDSERRVGVHERPVAPEHLSDFRLEVKHLGGGHGVPGIFLVLGEGGIEDLQSIFEAGWDTILIQIQDAVFYKRWEMGQGFRLPMAGGGGGFVSARAD